MVDTRIIAVVIGLSMAVMALVPLASYNASAAPSAQFLRADNILSTDATFYSDNPNDPAALNTIGPTTDFGTGGEVELWDSTPGCVLWGDAMSATDGSYGTGEVRYTVADLVGETASYYYLNFRLWSSIRGWLPEDHWTYATSANEALSFRVGFGYTAAAPTGPYEYINSTYQNMTAAGPTQGHDWLDVYNLVDGSPRPFTLAEMNALYVVIQMRFDPSGWGLLNVINDPPYNLGVCLAILQAVPTDYTPTPPQTGGFILRPNDDVFVTGYENYSVDGYEDMYGALNDTGRHGDADQSYVNASWSKSALLELGFTDPPAWATDVDYKVVFWCVIRQTETGIGTVKELTMGLIPDLREISRATFYPTTSYTNNTHASDFVPGTSNYWSLVDLEDIGAFFALTWVGDDTPTGEFRMTQCAFLVTPIVPQDYVPDAGEYEFEDVLDWLGEGNGFSVIFAVIGGIGLIATAPLMIIFYREGRESGIGAIALGACMIAASLGFLIVGTNAWA